jgi:hypothetical protein
VKCDHSFAIQAPPAKQAFWNENDMKRFGVLLASAALGAALGGHMGGFGGGWHGGMGGFGRGGWGWRNRSWGWGGGWGWRYPYAACYWGNPYCGYGYPDYAYDYGYPGYDYSYVTPSYAAAPLVTGRSVATGQLGNYCTNSAKACVLQHPSYVGAACSCRVLGGRARGFVTP